MLPSGLRLSQRGRLPVKFKMLAAMLVIPLCAAIYGVIDFTAADIEFGRNEQLGLAYVAPLSALLQEVTASPPPAAPRGLDALERLTTEQGDALQLAPKIAELRAQPTPAAVLALFSRVSSNAKLTADSDPDAYYTTTVTMDLGPKLAATAAELKVARTRMLHDSVVRAAKRAIAANPALASDLSTSKLDEAYELFVYAVDAPRYTPEQIEAAKQAGHELSRAALALVGRSANALDRTVAKRVDGFEFHRYQLVGMTVLLLLLAVAAVCSAGWQWLDSQVRAGAPVVANTKAAPEVLWPMATLRARAFVPYRAALKKTGTE